MIRWPGILAMHLVLIACQNQSVDYPERTPPAGFLQEAGNIAQGKALFLQKCAECHGTVQEGRLPTANRYHPRPAELIEPAYRQKDPAYLFWRIARGKQVEPYRSRGSVMPAWGPNFSDEQIWQLVAYIRSRAAAGEASAMDNGKP